MVTVGRQHSRHPAMWQNAKRLYFTTQQDRLHVVRVFRRTLQGAIVTLELALSSVVLAVLIGLVGAGRSCKTG